MSDALKNVILSRLPIVGLAAYSIQLPDRLVATECMTKSLLPSAAKQILTSLIQSGRTLLSANNESAHYCWSFDRHKVYVAARADGACLAILVENNPDLQSTRIQEALQAFIELESY
jgi:hypothetical protein